MKHDFENARRGAVIKDPGKTRVTIFLDNDVIEFFRQMATERGRGYQTEINAFLRSALDPVHGQHAGIGVDEVVGLQGQVHELVKAVGRIERQVCANRAYAKHRPAQRSFVREPRKKIGKSK